SLHAKEKTMCIDNGDIRVFTFTHCVNGKIVTAIGCHAEAEEFTKRYEHLFRDSREIREEDYLLYPQINDLP
ncbi:hypothetical protein, partial [Acetobacter thailandicus]|uniref:hypothetical protein n=1 Tax=Acetobacter thailandicus TaxID=1502842 RepID=UPI001BA8AC89